MHRPAKLVIPKHLWRITENIDAGTDSGQSMRGFHVPSTYNNSSLRELYPRDLLKNGLSTFDLSDARAVDLLNAG